MNRMAGIALGMALLLPPGLNAQELPDESDWHNLSRLQVDQRIAVKTKDNITHYGNFLAYSEEAISLREDKQEVGYRREEVIRVSLLGPPNRRKAALLGLAIGFTTAAGITAAIVAGVGDLTGGGKAGYIFGIGGLVGGIAGANIGAAVARATKTVIYRAKP